MSTEVGFKNVPHEVIPRILDAASMEKSSELLNYRLVSKTWHHQSEVLLETLWDQLIVHPPMGKASFPLKMNAISDTFKEVSTLIKFKKLAHAHRIDLKAIPSPIRIHDFQKGFYDHALKALWRRIHHLLIAYPNVPSIDASVVDIRAFLNDPANNAALMNVQQVDLGGLDLQVVPPEIERLGNLQILNLANNQLSQVPNFNLPRLNHLYLYNNQLKEVPNFNLPRLNHLYLYNNQLKEVPNFNLPLLTNLSLSDNQLSRVPNFNLPLLTQLILSNNQLSQVPNFNLPLLANLNLSNNQLKEAPNFNLPLLTHLGLSKNQLSQVPNFNLPRLTQLALANNQLKEIPNFNLPLLTYLGLFNNPLKEVPNFNLPNLTEFSLNGNILTDIPDAVLNKFEFSISEDRSILTLHPKKRLYQNFTSNSTTKKIWLIDKFIL